LALSDFRHCCRFFRRQHGEQNAIQQTHNTKRRHRDHAVAFLKFLAEHGIHAVLNRQSIDGNIYNHDLIKKEAA
jgi:hypothetical protein